MNRRPLATGVLAGGAALCLLIAPPLCEMAGAQTWAEKLNYGNAQTRVLIRHADDSGMFLTANQAIKDGMAAGEIDSTSAMAPLHFFDPVIDWYRAEPTLDVGIHLTFTSEWTNYKWGPNAPVEKVRRILTKNRVFRKDSLRVFFSRAPNTVGWEIQAQINRALVAMNPPLLEDTNPCIPDESRSRNGYGPPPPTWKLPVGCLAPTHFDSHMGALYTRKSYFKKFIGRVLKNDLLPITFENFNETFECLQNSQGSDLDINLFKWPIKKHIKRLKRAQKQFESSNWQYRRPFPRVDRYCSIPYGNDFVKTRDKLKTFLDGLDPGITMLFFHPTYEGSLLKISTNQWQKRVWDSKLFADPQIQQLFTAGPNPIQTTTWREMTVKCANLPASCK